MDSANNENNANSANPLKEIIKDKCFVIPMYQRNYKWNSDIAKKLAQDILDCYQSGNNKTTKSLGLLTLYKEDNSDTYYVIDGQQRFTTLSIMLNLLKSDTNIDLSFERDGKDERRKNAIKGQETIKCTDVNRINRNKAAIEAEIEEAIKKTTIQERKALAEFILENVIMLCSVVNELPVEEFMNLNAYKTAFSVSDHIRGNLISLNSFYKDTMSGNDYAPILARCLSRHSYKTAVAVLYNSIQEKLYEKQVGNGVYKSLYDLLKEKIIDPKKESRINILFSGMLKDGATNYNSGEITQNLDYWIQMLQKLAYINKLLDELESELKQGEFHSFKQIDDYQKMTNKSFIREVFDGISRLDQEWDSRTLAKEIQKYSNIDSVLIRCLNQDSKKLANRYLEAFVYSTVNEETNKKADRESWGKVKFPQMSMSEVVEEISGCGRYIIDRYELEHREDLNVNISIPPVIDLEDRENINFGGSLDPEIMDEDTITVGALFNYNIKIPVIQRDYCMGARITGENDFLSFLIDGFKNEKALTASTILISVSNDAVQDIYIFDGQQRTFTLYNILKYCEKSLNCETELKSYSFIGRNEKNDNSTDDCGSPYSGKAVEQLKEVLKNKLEGIDLKCFAEYIKNVKLKVKIVNDISGAEQFFMDINGGVALKKYEIFKAMLCSRLSDLKKDDVVKQIENEWLDFFYKYRKGYLKAENIEVDESDEEEILEIRFIEFVCRFVYKMNYKTETLLSFDEIESKAEMVTKLGYISKLDKTDIKQVVSIMNSITSIHIENNCNDTAGVEHECIDIKTNSTEGMLRICQLIHSGTKKEILENRECYIRRFIWSLSDGNRELLRKYYRYKNITGLREIYDNDQIMRDILLTIIGEEVYGEYYPYGKEVYGEYYPYGVCCDSKIHFYGGYQNKKIQVDKIYCKEIPAYYCNLSIPENCNILRIQYLCEKAGVNVRENKNLYFALVVSGLQYEDGTASNVIQVSEKIQYFYYKEEENWYIKCENDTNWIPLSTRSAYLFRYAAYNYLRKKIV